ncbi:phosphate ABC transporter permease PstA [Allobranchiibius sp. GilTou38]|uniref:phosphate ABC transporter permease PstA n=1 Tax=Allobranchiibius sp. GilTou38 TaxID=2815210 RepID=UPI001AA16B6E|nr:phosphate ABC transporter permease PstA [Allobranchiibius sp. GilTou38]MBO1767041.1 phosphate ABC transporter permease PstA [Allobranchiibius sp. GilTou38]
MSTMNQGSSPATSSRETLPGLDTGRSSSRAVRNVAATALVWAAFLIALIPLVWILWIVVSKGWHSIASATWWQKDQSGALPLNDTNIRGARHAIVGTIEIGLLTSVIAIPIAVLTAIYLVEYGRTGSALNRRIARVVSFMVDILSGIPSIVAALFVFAVWVTTLQQKLVPICVALALTMLMIPVVTRSTEEMLKLVPTELREASYALGVPKWKTVVRVVLPTAVSGIITGALLGLARVLGETAPWLFLTTYFQYLTYNPAASSGIASLPTLVYNQSAYINIPVSADRVWGGALTLILLVLAINLLGRLIGRLTRVKR